MNEGITISAEALEVLRTPRPSVDHTPSLLAIAGVQGPDSEPTAEAVELPEAS